MLSGSNKTNKKENDIMMNAINNKEARMETLKNAGVNINNFFDLSMRIPFGAEVKIVVDGKEMIIGQNNCQAAGVCSNSVSNGNIKFSDLNGNPIAYGVANLSDDPIVKNINQEGYIFNSKVDGRWIVAQTFKMLTEKSYNYKTRQYETGWDAYLRNYYGYMYQFSMMADEVHKLAKMEKDNDPEFAAWKCFFTKNVIYDTCKHYIYQLKKFVNHQPTRKYKGDPYVKLNKYGDVLKKDLYKKVYSPLEKALLTIKASQNYKMLENALKEFMKLQCKLPYDTPKCSDWKDAFKGKGAYVTLRNIVRFHNCYVINYETSELLDREGSLKYIDSLLEVNRGAYWKYHELLKTTIKANEFDLRKSIEKQHIENAN